MSYFYRLHVSKMKVDVVYKGCKVVEGKIIESKTYWLIRQAGIKRPCTVDK